MSDQKAITRSAKTTMRDIKSREDDPVCPVVYSFENSKDQGEPTMMTETGMGEDGSFCRNGSDSAPNAAKVFLLGRVSSQSNMGLILSTYRCFVLSNSKGISQESLMCLPGRWCIDRAYHSVVPAMKGLPAMEPDSYWND